MHLQKDSEEARNNLNIFVQAPTLAEAKPHLKKVVGSRFTDKYLASRYTSSSYGRSPTFPLRRDAVPAPSLSIPTAPSSPARKVISEFKSFAAPKSMMSMVGTPLNSSAETSAPDAMEDVTQSVELRFQAISLDQVNQHSSVSTRLSIGKLTHHSYNTNRRSASPSQQRGEVHPHELRSSYGDYPSFLLSSFRSYHV